MAQKRFLIDAGFETNADSKIAGDLDMTNGTITNVKAPTLAHHVATKFYVDEAVTEVISAAPAALDTLNELAAALGDDANFAATTTNALALKATITYVDSQISAATPSFSTLTGKPTTIAGYGITDGITATAVTTQIDAAAVTSTTYTNTAEADAVATASADATTKADAALIAAQTYADSAEADAIASAEAKDVVRATAAATDATTKADAAQTAAISTAATDATTKADAAEADAIASAEAKDVVRATAAASDATTKADAAEAAAISAAAADATTKANAAKSEAISEVTNGAGAAFDTLVEIQNAMATDAELSSAITSVTSSAASTAAADATTKANAAQAAAISTAASDATTKANAAQAAAQSYADANDTNTTYSIQDGELSEINFTSADHSKLNGIADSANEYVFPYNIDIASGGGSTVVRRSSGGYVYANYYAGTGTFSNTNTNSSGMTTFTGTNASGDTFGRAFTPAAARTLLNVADGANNYSLPSSVIHETELSSSVSSTSTTVASNSAAVKTAYDRSWPNTTYTAGNGMTLSGTQFLMSGSYTGDFTASGDVTAYSDIRFKHNVETITNAIDTVNNLRGVMFEKDNRHSTGVIAQEVEAVFPAVVHTNDEGLKSVAYGNIVGLLIEAVKEQQIQITSLQEAVKEQQIQITSLQGEINSLKT